MLKAYYFLWRRAGMMRDEFIEYYEEIHADLIVSNLPRASDFRRNYPAWQHSHPDQLGSLPFDVLTAITYDSRASFEEAMRVYRSPPFSEVVTEDELRFVNRGLVRFVPVDEVIDQISDDQWRPAPAVPEGAKLLRLTRRPATIDPNAFQSIYEAAEVSGIRPLINGCVDYRRNYIRVDDPFCFMTPELQAEIASHGLIGCDLVEELCFIDTVSAAAAAVELDAAPVVAGPLGGAVRTSAISCVQHVRAPSIGTGSGAPSRRNSISAAPEA